MKPLLIRAINREKIERPPVWLMRQAGRYLTEYCELREQHGFLGLCKSPELAAEVTLQPLQAFDLDAAIIFSDILLPAESLGFELAFAPGPVVANPLRTADDVTSRKAGNIYSSLRYVYKALKIVREELNRKHVGKALLGFAGAPWTLACYLIEQGPFKQFYGAQVFASKHPQAIRLFLDKLTDIICEYVTYQVENGAEVIQLFDTWAGILSTESYRSLALPYTEKIIEQIKKAGASSILYVNGCSHLLPLMKQSGADVLSIDWRIPLPEAENVVGDDVALQGNLNPASLFAPPETITQEVTLMLGSVRRKTGYIVNTGHGVLPTTPRESVSVLADTVKKRGKL